MTLNITLDELLAWNAEERAKWLPWLKANPAALNVPLQPGGRFPTVWSLIDHIFLVEVRHILRLQRQELPTETGVAAGDIDGPLRLRRSRPGSGEIATAAHPRPAGDLNTPRDVVVSDGTFPLSPRKLLLPHGAARGAALAAGRRCGGADGRLHPARELRSVLFKSADLARRPQSFLARTPCHVPVHRSEGPFRSRCRAVLIAAAVAAVVRGVADEVREFVGGAAADAAADGRDQFRSRQIGRRIGPSP